MLQVKLSTCRSSLYTAVYYVIRRMDVLSAHSTSISSLIVSIGSKLDSVYELKGCFWAIKDRFSPTGARENILAQVMERVHFGIK